MLELQSWWPAAGGLEHGQRKRVNHDCGPGRTLLINRDDKGYHAWCHRCNDKGWKPPPTESLAEKLARLARLRAGDSTLPQDLGRLPEPAVYVVDEWPVEARLWLYKAGLGKQEIGQLGAYWHNPSARVVLPVLEGGRTIFYQARAVDGRQPKYLGPQVDKSKVVPSYGQADQITLTEDILSAFKVGLVAEAWSMLGTNPSAGLIQRLLKRQCPVNVWLDSDVAGRRAARKVGNTLRAYGLQVRDICTDKDPKLLFREDIKLCLSM